ncbi:MAG: hypothetical protein ACHQ5A_08045 [Opitutales bacterium]
MLGLSLLLGTAGLGAAETPSLDSLVANSPFAGQAGNRGRKDAAATPLEFRGVLYEGSTAFFSLYEAATKQSAWVELKEGGLNYTVKGYDPANSKLQVEYQGRTLTLPLVQAPKTARPMMPVAANPATPPANPGGNPNLIPPAPNPQLPAQIAEEIRRRRALRQQAVTSPAPTPAKP